MITDFPRQSIPLRHRRRLRHVVAVSLSRRFAATAAVIMLLLVTTACGGDDDKESASDGASSNPALLTRIPSLGDAYPAGVDRFVDTDATKDYGLAVAVADDGAVVAYVCDGKTLGRAFQGRIEDGATTAELTAVTGGGTVTLELSGRTPRTGSVDTDGVTEDFALGSTNAGGYFRAEIEDSIFGWVVGDTGEIKGVQTKQGRTVSAMQTPPLTPEEQQLVPVNEDPSGPPESFGFIKNVRCNRLQNQYQTASTAFADGPIAGADAALNDANLALAKAKSLGCAFAKNSSFFPV